MVALMLNKGVDKFFMVWYFFFVWRVFYEWNSESEVIFKAFVGLRCNA